MFFRVHAPCKDGELCINTDLQATHFCGSGTAVSEWGLGFIRKEEVS